ncbi:right-handed parallel beta-helix repeat-containing protein [candidate division KSB1 bacterium]|nr:right-handed parallel beta-helix repeat-containing protein [candidate division KSB1 bacterium]
MTKFFGSLGSLLLVGLLIGCTSPTSHKPEPPTPKRDGVPLDRTLTEIFPSATGKPWLIDSDWVIGPDDVVRIHEGTEFIFDINPSDTIGPVWVDVQGQLIADGSPDAPIIFTTAFVDKDRGHWRGFKLRNPDPARGSVFEHCVFEYGAYFDVDTVSDRGTDAQLYRGMLSIINSSPRIERCVVYYNQNNAVFISGQNARPTIRFNIFTENDASAVRADTLVDLDEIVLAYNDVADNSAIAFLMGYDSTRFGKFTQVNSNLDSCDQFFNVEISPLFVDAPNGDFGLQPCSPAIDAGPTDSPQFNDADGTRADMGISPYLQSPGELRGVLAGTDIVLDPAVAYRMSCDLRVNFGQTLTIPAGTTIEINDVYDIEAFGRIRCMGTADNPVRFWRQGGTNSWGTMTIHEVDSMQRRPAPWTFPSEFRYTEFVNYQSINIEKPGAVFEACKFERGFFYGAWVNLPSKNIEDSVNFSYCDFLECGAFGLVIAESPAGVRNCKVVHAKGRGITVWKGGDKVAISNCIVDACSTSGIVIEVHAHPLILNNSIRDCGYYGLQITDQSRPVVMNTIVVNSARYGVYTYASALPYLDYNCFFNNYTLGNQNLNFGPPESGGDTLDSFNDVTDNPLLGADFQLGAGSPAIDAGNPEAPYNDVDASRNDMGAFGGPQGGRVGRFSLPRNPHTLAAK